MNWPISTYTLLARERIDQYLREASNDRRAKEAAAGRDGRGVLAWGFAPLRLIAPWARPATSAAFLGRRWQPKDPSRGDRCGNLG